MPRLKRHTRWKWRRRNARVVKAMGMKEAVMGRWGEVNEVALERSHQANVLSHVISNITKVVRLFIQVITMAVSGYLVLQNQMSPGGIIATSILVGRALAPFDAAIATWKSLVLTRKSYARLRESINTVPIQRQEISLPDPKGHVFVEKLFYTAPVSSVPIIKGIHLAIEAGQIIGMIGPSGAGKDDLCRVNGGNITGIFWCGAVG